VSNENEPVTKKDLAELSANLSAELSANLSANLSADFTAKFTSMEKRLLLEMGHVVNVVIEQIGSKVAVIDDKYEGPMREIRADLDTHCANSALHTRPAPLAPKRASRRKPQRTR